MDEHQLSKHLLELHARIVVCESFLTAFMSSLTNEETASAIAVADQIAAYQQKKAPEQLSAAIQEQRRVFAELLPKPQ